MSKLEQAIELVQAGDKEAARQLLGRILRDDPPLGPIEYRVLSKSGQIRWMRTSSKPILGDGRVVGLRGVLADKGEIDAKDINEAAKAGDKLAAEMWNEATYYLAQACVSYCRIFDPDRIVLAGGMTNAGEDLMRPLRAHFEHLDWKLMDTPTELTIASLGSDAGSIGAAGVAWQVFGGE